MRLQLRVVAAVLDDFQAAAGDAAVEDLLGWQENATPEAVARRKEREERYGLLGGGVDSATVIRASREVRDHEAGDR